MTLARPNVTLHWFALWCALLIPPAAALSRFAADLLLILSCVLFLGHALFHKRTDCLKPRWIQFALLLWVYILVRACFAQDASDALVRAFGWVRYPLFAAALQLWILQTPRHFALLLQSLCFAVSFLILDTALQIFTGVDLLMREPIPAEMGVRLTGPYSSPIIGIMLIWLAIPCICVWVVRALSRQPQAARASRMQAILLAGLFSVGTLSIIFMSGERMALLLSGLALVLAFFLLPIAKKRLFTLAAFGALILGLIAYSHPNLVGRQIGATHRVISEFGASAYGQIWQSAAAMIQENPVAGVGMRHFRVHCPEAAYGATDAATLAIRCNLHPHNMYLEWLVESGMIGFALFMAMLLCMARDVARAYPPLKAHPVFIGLIITACIRLWPLAATTSFFTAWSAVPLWLMLGWLLAMSARKQEFSSC